MDQPFDLVVIWAGIIGFAVMMYVLMDGFDLGQGILYPFAPDDHSRDIMMNSVAPVWDGNETWQSGQYEYMQRAQERGVAF